MPNERIQGRRIRRLSVGLLLVLARIHDLPGQTVPTRQLGPPTGKLSHEFSMVNSIRELSDGRVLITDFIENQLMIADLRRDQVIPFGRIGDGPGEYRQVFPLRSMGADTTLMGNAIARRWLMITRDTVMTTLAPARSLATRAQAVAAVLGFDEHGHMLAARMAPRTTPAEVAIPIFTVLLAVQGSREDTVDVRKKTFAKMGAPDGPSTLPLLTTDDDAVITPDGWIAIVRHAPYRVEWRSPDGRWTRGPVVNEPRIALDATEKGSYLARLAELSTPTNSRKPGSASGPGSSGKTVILWPTHVPPFDGAGAVFPAQGNRVVVRRTPSAARPEPRYDMFNGNGVRQYQMFLDGNQRIQGTGSEGVYLVTTDDDGIERVSRHAWPDR